MRGNITGEAATCSWCCAVVIHSIQSPHRRNFPHSGPLPSLTFMCGMFLVLISHILLWLIVSDYLKPVQWCGRVWDLTKGPLETHPDWPCDQKLYSRPLNLYFLLQKLPVRREGVNYIRAVVIGGSLSTYLSTPLMWIDDWSGEVSDAQRLARIHCVKTIHGTHYHYD